MMEYDAEMITNLSRQVAETFKAALAQDSQAGDGVMSIAEVETELRELLRQTGAQALSMFLSAALGTPVAEIPCECGGILHYQRRREATIVSVFGKIRYERAY